MGVDAIKLLPEELKSLFGVRVLWRFFWEALARAVMSTYALSI